MPKGLDNPKSQNLRSGKQTTMNDPRESEVPSKRMRKYDEDWGESASSFNNLIQSMLENRIDTDVIIKVESENGKKEIECHSMILNAHSPVLSTMLSDRWTHKSGENPKIITVTGDNPDHFAVFVKMMYWDWNKQTFEKYSDPATRDLTPEVIVGVLSLAYKYLASHLIRRSEHEIFCYLLERRTADNLSLFMLLRRLPICGVGQVARQIYRRVETCIWSNAEDLFSSDEIFKLNDSDLLWIIQSDLLQCSEDKIYTGCYKWALEQCGLQNLAITGENVRKVLGEIIKYIRFPIMDNVTLTDVVFSKKILTQEESFDLMIYKANKNADSFKEKPLGFSDKERVDKNAFYVIRLQWRSVSETLKDFSSPHGFVMKTSKKANLSALGLYVGPGNLTYHVEVKVGNKKCINRDFKHNNFKPGTKAFTATFREKIKIPADTPVTIKFSISGGPTYVCKENVKEQAKEISYWANETVITTFELSPDIPNGLNQIPWLTFAP